MSQITFSIAIPWPPKILSPNARPHWAALARAKKDYRHACYVEARATHPEERGWMRSAALRGCLIRCRLVISPPNRHRRDEDNLTASLKAGLDGIADAIGVDDSRLRWDRALWGDVVRGGRIVVEMTAEEQQQ